MNLFELFYTVITIPISFLKIGFIRYCKPALSPSQACLIELFLVHEDKATADGGTEA